LGIVVFCAATVSVDAQQSSNEYGVNSEPTNKSIHRTWQIGGFAAGGFPPYYMVHDPRLHYQEELLFTAPAWRPDGW
jgi:hypothetical protein